MLPNFLIIGAPKSGTTSIKASLKAHPDVFMAPDSPSREPHYLTYASEGWPRWAIKSEDAYASLFSTYEGQSIRAEKSTWYLYSQKSASFAAEILPNPKALAILRNPIERAFSAFQFNRQQGWDGNERFQAALIKEQSIKEFDPAPDRMYSKAGFYSEAIRRWTAALDSQNVLTLIYDDIKQDYGSQLKAIFDFLEISDQSDSITRLPSQNITKPVRSGTLVKTKKKLRWIKSMLPEPVHRRLVKRIDSLNTRSKAVKIPLESARHLAVTHEADVAALSEHLDRDLVKLWIDPYK